MSGALGASIRACLLALAFSLSTGCEPAGSAPAAEPAVSAPPAARPVDQGTLDAAVSAPLTTASASSPSIAKAAAVAGPTALPPDAIQAAIPPEFSRFPALMRAAEAASLGQRQAFEAAVAAAVSRGEDVSQWRMRIAWRVILGNRYLRVAQGDGVRVQGAVTTPVVERITYDGISGDVLALDDWFDDAAVWPVIAGLERRARAGAAGAVSATQPQRVGAGAPAPAASTYEPVFSADGPVMGFELVYPPGRVAPASDGVQRVRIPLDAVAPFLDETHRASLEALAGSG